MGDFRIGECLINPQRSVVQRGNIDLQLEPEVMAVLVCLAREAGEVVAKDQIAQVVWPHADAAAEDLDSAVVELRRALGDNPRRPHIIQEREHGYALILPVYPPEALPQVKMRWLWVVLLIVPGVLAILFATLWFWP